MTQTDQTIWACQTFVIVVPTWLHHARAALRALGQQDTGGADHG